MVGLRSKKCLTDVRQTNVFGQRDDSLQSFADPPSTVRSANPTSPIRQSAIQLLSKREQVCLVGLALLHAALNNNSTNCTLATNILVHMLLNALKHFLILCFMFC